ncbi:MAG: hypothetical protein Q8P18_27040 [Pseudomonadota bacterium]|nr:hypothetical protein [Pseudomonadota bacterium]
MRTLLPLLVLAAACSTEPAAPAPAAPPQPIAPAAVPAPAAPGHAGAEHAHASPHGGEVKTVGERHVEALFMPGGIMFYVSDAGQKPLSLDGLTGSAVVKGPSGVETVTLAPMGDHLHAAARLAQGDAATAVLTLTVGGKAESVSFEVKSVGLQEHDHTSLHGGQVGMWGDYHLEYAPQDDEHRVWVTDAKRAQVTGVSGSLKDGDTVVPLTFDPATGVLSGKLEGAGTRPVMVDVKVGETSFSLGFNPAAAAPTGGHDHGAHDHGTHGH